MTNTTAGQRKTGSYRIAVRFAPRYGHRDTLIPCPHEWAASHARALADRWTLLSVEDAGPGFPPGTLDMHFSIPAGSVREFERDAAPSGGWARIIRQ